MNYNQNSGYGLALMTSIYANVGTFGNVFIVLSSSDSSKSKFQHLQETFRNDPDGRVRFFTDVAAAYDAMVSNNNDVMVLDGDTEHALSAMLTISKNRVHFVGLDYLLGDRRKYGQSTKITLTAPGAATDVFMIKNLGVRNSFKGIKFTNSATVTENVAAFGEGGEYTVFRNCEFYDSTKLTSDTHAELVQNGDSTQFFDCTIGSLADSVTGDKIRPAILLTKGTVGAGLVSRDVLFDGCKLWKNAGGTTTAFVKGAATDVERVMEFHDCAFIANVLGAQPAVAIDVATLTVGQIILTGDTFASECTKIATATGVLNATPARVATATIAIQAT